MSGSMTSAASSVAVPGRTAETPHRSRLPGAVAAIGVAAVTGVVAATVMPRGPATRGEVVAALVTGFVLGLAGGALMRSRWSVLVLPAAFAVTVELTRLDVVGPSVDLPRLDSTVGVLALVLGRGVAAILQLLPIAVGAAYGAALARRSDDMTPRRRPIVVAGRLSAALVVVALVAAGVVLTRPPRTAPILDADGRAVPGSVAELATVRLGGHDQRVLIRGRSTANPVVLYLAGGPGQSDLGYTRALMPTMEDDVVFAVWDQRGTGTSYAALDPQETWTLDRAVADTVELSEYLSRRFRQRQIVLVGNSWGTLLGTLAVQRRPDLYAAYLGAGQMVDVAESDRIIYQDMLALAQRTGDHALAERLRGSGPPPYPDVYGYATQLELYDRLAPYRRTAWFESHRPGGLDGNGVPEYGPLDKLNKLKALFDMGAVMYPQLQAVDFRRDVPRLQVPVYLVEGRHELRARLDPARAWFTTLKAPAKHWVEFPGSGHVPQFEEYGRFRELLVGTVLPAARAAG
jgi:pimeloyl-ACP methyl ester carboxylesterase